MNDITNSADRQVAIKAHLKAIREHRHALAVLEIMELSTQMGAGLINSQQLMDKLATEVAKVPRLQVGDTDLLTQIVIEADDLDPHFFARRDEEFHAGHEPAQGADLKENVVPYVKRVVRKDQTKLEAGQWYVLAGGAIVQMAAIGSGEFQSNRGIVYSADGTILDYDEGGLEPKARYALRLTSQVTRPATDDEVSAALNDQPNGIDE